MTRAHVPVLAGELIELTAPAPGETVVDCTFGAGGHARLIADRIGLDRARSSASTATRSPRSTSTSSRARWPARRASCAWTTPTGSRCCARRGVKADVVYLDLGISSMQVDARERGFSYSYDAPLDMRMDPSQELDAREIVNTWDERRLAQLFRRLRRGPATRGGSRARS